MATQRLDVTIQAALTTLSPPKVLVLYFVLQRLTFMSMFCYYYFAYFNFETLISMACLVLRRFRRLAGGNSDCHFNNLEALQLQRPRLQRGGH